MFKKIKLFQLGTERRKPSKNKLFLGEAAPFLKKNFLARDIPPLSFIARQRSALKMRAVSGLEIRRRRKKSVTGPAI